MAKRRTRVMNRVAMTKVTCAFCEGRGTDPFGILSERSTCQVCGGNGKVTTQTPTRRCAFCGGTGVFPGRRLTCTTCMGKGIVTVSKGAKECSECEGTGQNTGGLSCTACNGKGFV